jgi:hypothetical protein
MAKVPVGESLISEERVSHSNTHRLVFWASKPEPGPKDLLFVGSGQGRKSETSVLPILPRTRLVLPSYSLRTPLVLPSYSPRTPFVLPSYSLRTSSYFLVLPRTPSYSLRTSFVLREYGSLAFSPLGPGQKIYFLSGPGLEI